MVKLIYSSICIAFMFVSSFLYAESNFIATNNARVQLLNKVTGKTIQVTLSKNKTYRFDQNLQVILRQCYKSAQNDKRENEAFLQVVRLVYEKENDTVFSSFNEKIPIPAEIIPPSPNSNAVNHVIFSGWMFSSSPSISLLEDKIYSVSLLQCMKMLTAIEQFFINHATAITTIAAIADIFAVLATIWIAFLTYQNIRESRRATIVAQEKKNVIEACQYAIQFTVLLEKCEEEFKKINIIPKSFWSKDLENEYGSNMIYAETVTPVKKAAQKRMSMITSNNMEEINKIEEIIDKIKEPIHRKVTELRTVSAFLPEDANKQIHFLQSYYKHLGGINNFLSKNEGEIVTKIDKFMESQQKKLEEMGFSSSTAYFESLQKYFHENIKSVIANKKFSLHNLAKQWVPYESFIKNNL